MWKTVREILTFFKTYFADPFRKMGFFIFSRSLFENSDSINSVGIGKGDANRICRISTEVTILLLFS